MKETIQKIISWIIKIMISIIILGLTVICIKKFGYRYAGIKELKRLEERVEKLENNFYENK